MILTQHTPGLKPWLASFGCSTLAAADLVGKEFEVGEMNDLYDEAIAASCFLFPETPQGALIWGKFFSLLNAKYNTKLSYAGAVERDYIIGVGQEAINHYYISLDFPDHFTRGDLSVPKHYDPSGTGNAWDHGILLNKRIVNLW